MAESESNRSEDVAISRAEYLPIAHIPIVSSRPDSDFYDMSHLKRGKAYIFNHKKYSIKRLEKLRDREGTDKDRDRLDKILKALDFEVVVFNDLTASEVKDKLRRLANEDHSECDCVLVAVLSHGEKGKIEAYDVPYEMEELWENFTADKSPSLAGKPKLFFIQACRGKEQDSGTKIYFAVTDGPSSHSYPVPTAFSPYKIPNQSDFLIAFATTPEHAAWRYTDLGSWFIQALCRVLEENGRDKNLLWMVTKVSRIVAIEFGDSYKQIPCVVSLLTRDLYFTPKVDPHVAPNR